LKEESTPNDVSASHVTAFNTAQQNYYDGLESQSDVVMDFDDSRLGTKDNNNSSSTGLSGYSACCVTLTHPSLFSARHLSSFLAADTKQHTFSQDATVHLLNHDDVKCCTNSGATHHMINDYTTFLSYHPVLIKWSPSVMSPPQVSYNRRSLNIYYPLLI
jgi:hypothetical protein